MYFGSNKELTRQTGIYNKVSRGRWQIDEDDLLVIGFEELDAHQDEVDDQLLWVVVDVFL